MVARRAISSFSRATRRTRGSKSEAAAHSGLLLLKPTAKEPNANETRTGEIDASSISALISFFQLLDKWDRDAKRNAEIV